MRPDEHGRHYVAGGPGACTSCGRAIDDNPFPARCWTCVYRERAELAEERLRWVLVAAAAIACGFGAAVAALARGA